MGAVEDKEAELLNKGAQMAWWNNLFSRLNNYARTTVYNWLFPDSGVLTQEQIEEAIQNIVVLSRRYYDGDHVLHLTKRQQAWLDEHGGKVRFTVNHCPTVVDVVVERLKVIGFNTPGNETAAKTLWQWWQDNRMDMLQIETHRAAGRDGEAFMLVSWNEEEDRPDFTFHPRFTDLSYRGDGYGMWLEYPNNDYLAKPTRAVKQWQETGPDRRIITRRTEYYPDRIERKSWNGAGWNEYADDEIEAVQPWVDKEGKPLGIPVVHLRTPGIKPDLYDVIPLQDALNKAWLDIMAAADMTGFRMLAFFGWIPTTDGKEPKEDGSNIIQVAPGQMMGTLKSPGDAAIQPIEPASAQPLLDVEERVVLRIAAITHTPTSRFVTTRQVAAEGTLKQQEAPLIAKVKERQTLFGNGWEDAMKMAVKLAETFGGQSLNLSEISTEWENPEIRDETLDIDNATKKKALGVPQEKLLAEIGYTQEEVDEFKGSTEWQAREAALTSARINAENVEDVN